LNSIPSFESTMKCAGFLKAQARADLIDAKIAVA
jgi:hypothetical protein